MFHFYLYRATADKPRKSVYAIARCYLHVQLMKVRHLMTQIKFRYEWYDDDETVMHYSAQEDWNWRDYHSCVRASIFAMHRHPHPVDSLVDFRESERDAMPAGLTAHLSSFGKILTPALTGDAVVLGLPADAQASLPLDDDGTLATRDGRVYFAATETAAQGILDQLKRNRHDA